MNHIPFPPSAAEAANAVAESVQYQGRKTSRKGSEQRRQAILDASMRIIVRDGVRAVRHRAVASEANVPLSATTYYFKDINDLITDTFAQFVERSAEYMAEFWQSMQAVVVALAARLDGSAEARQQVVDELAELAMQYIHNQLQERREHLIAERAFFLESLLNPRLYGLAQAHRWILLQGVTHFFEILGSSQPQEDGELLTALILQMEYRGLLEGIEQQDRQAMLAIFKRYIDLALGR
ncbi:TetR family transcriptional regulator [Pseudomonas sp. GOM7]|uniref:TetR/AcrR family transcriptional regulator n=1 Tax=unclassified Pseudomonas TaxID=196821 RepID=UPI00227B58DF|nr:MULTISPECIES: TetR family transcriptional regulator [unclassified Pseudomonas]WAJ40073.1 TetR family transcriptional regulator [Pseudomonas sp. GOM7]